MNILILTTDYPPHALWGMGQYVHTLVRGILKYHEEVKFHVVTTNKSSKLHGNIITTSQEQDEQLLSNASDEVFNNYNKFIRWNEVLAERVILEKQVILPIDIIYCNNWMSWKSARIIQCALGGKIVVGIHFLQKQYEKMQENPIPTHHNEIIAIETEMITLADSIICFSDESARLVVEYTSIAEKKLHIIHHTSSLIERAVDITKKDPCAFVYIGRLTKDKGIHELIYICREISHQYPITLHIIGDGVLCQYLSTLPDNFIRYHGYLEERESIFSILATCSFSFLLSTSEVFPLSVVESMMCGAFPIISDLPTVPKMFDNTISGIRVPGILTQSGSLQPVVKILLSLISSQKQLQEKQQATIQYYYDHYSLKQMTNQTISVFREILSI